MDAETLPWPSLRWFFDMIGVGGFVGAGGLIWRASGRVTRAEKDIESLRTFRGEQQAENALRAARVDDLARQHGALAVSVAALPTRDEMRDMLTELSANLRDPPEPKRPRTRK